MIFVLVQLHAVLCFQGPFGLLRHHHPRTRAVSPLCSEEDDCAQFFSQWLSRNGATGIGDSVILRKTTERGGFGLYAKKDLVAGENVLTLPPACYLTEDTALDGDLSEYYFKCLEALSELYGFHSDRVPIGEPLLAVQLLVEASKGWDSSFFPYLFMLPNLGQVASMRPDSIDAAWMWSKEEKSAVLGELEFEAARVQQSVDDEFEQLNRLVFRSFAHIFPPSVFTLDNYRSAKVACILCKSFPRLSPRPPRSQCVNFVSRLDSTLYFLGRIQSKESGTPLFQV